MMKRTQLDDDATINPDIKRPINLHSPNAMAKRRTELAGRLRQLMSFCPGKAIIRFKRVCHDWRDGILKDDFLPQLQSLHHQKKAGFFLQIGRNLPRLISLDEASFGVPEDPFESLYPYGNFTMMSECTGLIVCLLKRQFTDYQNLSIVNPCTGTMTMVSPTYFPHNGAVLACHPSSSEDVAQYDLISPSITLIAPKIWHYSGSTKKWSKTPVPSDFVFFHWESGVYWNGSICWRSREEIREDIIFVYNLDSSTYIAFLEMDPKAILGTVNGKLAVAHIEDEGNLIVKAITRSDLEPTEMMRIPVPIDQHTFEATEIMRVQVGMDLNEAGGYQMVCFVDRQFVFKTAERVFVIEVTHHGIRTVAEVECKNSSVRGVPYVNSLNSAHCLED